MNEQLIARLVEELEAMPMEGGNSESDQAIQDFLDFLDTL